MQLSYTACTPAHTGTVPAPPALQDMIKPRARAAPMMCVLRNTLWMLGGQVEIAHTDIVLGEGEPVAGQWLGSGWAWRAGQAGLHLGFAGCVD